MLPDAILTPSPDRVALLGPATASAAARESSAALAASPGTESPGQRGTTGASMTAAAPSCYMAGSQLPARLPASSQKNTPGCGLIRSSEDEVNTQAQQQQQQQQDATVSTSTKQPTVPSPGLANMPSTQEGSQIQQAAFPCSDGSDNTSAILYPFPTQRSPHDRLEGVLRSEPCAEDVQGLYVFGGGAMALVEHGASASAGQAEGQPCGQSDGQSGQAEGTANGNFEGQADGQGSGQVDEQADGQSTLQAEGQADGATEGQVYPSHRQDKQSEQQAVQHAVPLQSLVPCSPLPSADKEPQPHTEEGVSQSAPCSKAAATASFIAEDPAAASEEITMPAAVSKAGLEAAAAAEAMSVKRMPEVAAVAAQNRLAQLKAQHDKECALALGDKPSDAASHPAAAETPSAARSVAPGSLEPASSAAAAAAPDVSMPAQSAATGAAPDASEPAQAAVREAASEEAIPAPVPCRKAATGSLTVSPGIAAAAAIYGKQSKKRKSKYFSETFDQKKRRINRTRKTKAENRAARAVDAALPWSASTKGRLADSLSISGETGTTVSASLSASISNGPGMLHSPFSLLLQVLLLLYWMTLAPRLSLLPFFPISPCFFFCPLNGLKPSPTLWYPLCPLFGIRPPPPLPFPTPFSQAPPPPPLDPLLLYS